MENYGSNSGAPVFKKLTLIFVAMAIGQVVVFTVFFNTRLLNAELHSIFQYPAVAVTIAAILVAPWLYLRLLAPCRGTNMPFGGKMSAYFSANIVKLAILEGAALFCLVCLFLTGQLYYAYLFLAVFFAFMLHRPTPVKCVADLQLNDEERMYLEQ